MLITAYLMCQVTSDTSKSAVNATELKPDASFGIIENLRLLRRGGGGGGGGLWAGERSSPSVCDG